RLALRVRRADPGAGAPGRASRAGACARRRADRPPPAAGRQRGPAAAGRTRTGGSDARRSGVRGAPDLAIGVRMSAADQLRRLPKFDRTLEHPALVALGLRRGVIRRVVVEAIDAERERILAAARDDREPSPPVADLDAIASRVRARLDDWLIPH